MREFDELQLAMIVLGSIHEQHGVTVSLRRGGGGRAAGPVGAGGGHGGARMAACGPAGWRAVGRRECGGGVRPERWTVWAARPYEAACRLAEMLDRAGGSVA